MSGKMLGDQGESYVAEYLRTRGYHILEQKYRTKSGEIDLIADDHGTLVFIEVKTRSSFLYGIPAEAVHYRKKQKIIQTAYLQQKHMEERLCRFDVFEVYALGGVWKIHQIKGAFET